jgi:hypothetical protein
LGLAGALDDFAAGLVPDVAAGFAADLVPDFDPAFGPDLPADEAVERVFALGFVAVVDLAAAFLAADFFAGAFSGLVLGSDYASIARRALVGGQRR